MQSPDAANSDFGRVVARIQSLANTDLGYGAQKEMGVADLEAKKVLLTRWIKTARERGGNDGSL
jgi:hypothetical protein